jgi:hypothetical protein
MAPLDDPLERLEQEQRKFQGPGGTPGGLGLFALGSALSGLGLYLLLDSVRISTGHVGWLSGGLRTLLGSGHAAGVTTASMGVLFVPFICGVCILFYNARLKVGWWVLGAGVLILLVEMFSQIRFYMSAKLTHFLMMLVMIGGGLGLILRSFRDFSAEGASARNEGPAGQHEGK